MHTSALLAGRSSFIVRSALNLCSMASRTKLSLEEVVDKQIDLTEGNTNSEMLADVRRIMNKINLVYFLEDEFEEGKDFVERMAKK